MELFLLHSNIRNDERFLQLSAIGRLTYLLVAVAFDDNHGHAEFNITSLVAQAFPVEQRRADAGDPVAMAWIAEARSQLLLMVDPVGIFMVEETRGGPIIAYRQWERYYGKRRTKRGCPKFPMGPVIAATRDWSKISPNSYATTLAWAEDCGVLDLVRPTIGGGSTQARTVPEQSQNKAGTVPELSAAKEVKGLGLWVRGLGLVEQVSGGGGGDSQASDPTSSDTTTTDPLRGEEPEPPTSTATPTIEPTELQSAFVTVDCTDPDATASQHHTTPDDLLRLAEYVAERAHQDPRIRPPALFRSMLRRGEHPPDYWAPEHERQRLAAETAAQQQATEQQSDAELERERTLARLSSRGVSQADHERWQACREAAIEQGILPRGLSAMVDVRWVGTNGQMVAELVTSRLSAPRVEAEMDAFRKAVGFAGVGVVDVRVVQHDPGREAA